MGLNEDFFNFIHGLKYKTLYIFGASKGGVDVSNFIRLFSTCQLFFLDNDKAKWGNKINGILVKSPEDLLQDNQDNILILIASIYYREIAEQLEMMGFKEKVQYFNGLHMLNTTVNFLSEYISSLKNNGKISETSKVRDSLAPFCVGNGIDIGYGGDPITESAICMDLPDRYASYKNHPQHLRGDATDLYWFRDNCLDYIYSSHVLEDFENTESVLNEWLRVLKIGGLLILFLPDEQEYRKYCKVQNKLPNIHHIHEFFSLSYIKKLLQNRSDIEIIHEKFPSHIYSFELVIKKKG